MKKYVYLNNSFLHFMRGFLPVSFTSKPVTPHHDSTTYVWRDSPAEIPTSADISSSPIALSSFLVLQWKERMLLEGKVARPDITLAKAKHNVLSQDYNQKSLKEVRENLRQGVGMLSRLMSAADRKNDFPVAFASQALYVIERSGAEDLREHYEDSVLPVLRNKRQHLHAEGVAQAVWGLAKAQIWDQQIWDGLKKLIAEKDFNVTFVKNKRWSANQFETHAGSEHHFESEVNPFVHDLFFQDKIVLFELYNGLQAAKNHLDLSNEIKLVEERYGDLLRQKEAFNELESVSYSQDLLH